MGRFFLVFAAVMVLGFFSGGAAKANVLDFENKFNLGVTLGGWTAWDDVGGGHLLMENWSANHYIYFSSPTYVNSFEMNAMPFEGYSGGCDIGYADMAAFDSGGVQVWSATVDLTGYTSWSDWLVVGVETGNISSMTFYPTGVLDPFDEGFWPSVDNMVINESAVPIPGAVWLLGSGLIGLVGLRRKFKD